MPARDIGDKLRLIRTERGLSKKEVARHLHTSRTTVASWERNGDIRLRHLLGLCDLCGVPALVFMESLEHSPRDLAAWLAAKKLLDVLHSFKPDP